MLSKKYRLKGADIYAKKGRKISFKFFVLVKSENTLDYPRFAFIISKKISAKAVVRNRIKRAFSEKVRSLLPEIEQGVDYIFFVRGAVVDANSQEIENEIEKCLKK